MSNRMFLILLSVCGTVVFSSCYPTGENKINQDDITDYINNNTSVSSEKTDISDSEDKINIELENVRVNLNLPDIDADSAKEISVKMREWNNEELKEIFLKDKGGLSEWEFESSNYDNMTVYNFKSEDETYLNAEAGYIRYTTNNFNEYQYSFIKSMVFNYDMAAFFKNDELANFSLNDAEEKINVYLEKLGITNLNKPITWAVTAEESDKCFDLFGITEDKYGNPRKHWDTKQQCYIFIYPFQYDRLDFSVNREQYVLAVVTEDEVIEFECSCVCDFSEVQDKDINMKCDSEKALNIVVNEYEKMAVNSKINITGCDLIYINNNSSRSIIQNYIPVWDFELIIETDDIGTNISHRYVDLQTNDIL